MVPYCVPEEYVTESGDIVEFVELDEGQFKDIDVRKGDLKLAKDKKELLKIEDIILKSLSEISDINDMLKDETMID